MPMKPKQTVGATEFKAHCLALLDQVAQDRVALVVTKHGRPVAKLVPYEEEAPGQAFGILAGTVKAADDLTAPTGEAWKADA
jgi:prevent-host-death family protein